MKARLSLLYSFIKWCPKLGAIGKHLNFWGLMVLFESKGYEEM
jgi:hypothetical protein